MSVVIGNAQDVGSRDRQEDYLSSKKIGDMDVAILADGMGGYEGGDQASLTVTQAFISFIEQQARKYPLIPDLLVDAAYSANAQLAQLKQNAQSNMGSTLVAVLVQGNHAWWVSIGDSLLYLWRDGRLQKLNADHSHYQDLRQKVFLGQLSTAQAANDPERDGLTSALMGREMKHVDVSRFGIELKSGDIFLLASDGLETLSAEQITSILQRVSIPQQVSGALVQQVLRANAQHQDNVSVLAIGVGSQKGISPSTRIVSSPQKNWFSSTPLTLLTGLFLGVGIGVIATKIVAPEISTDDSFVKSNQQVAEAPSIVPDSPKLDCQSGQSLAKKACEGVFEKFDNSLPHCSKVDSKFKILCEQQLSESTAQTTPAPVSEPTPPPKSITQTAPVQPSESTVKTIPAPVSESTPPPKPITQTAPVQLSESTVQTTPAPVSESTPPSKPITQSTKENKEGFWEWLIQLFGFK